MAKPDINDILRYPCHNASSASGASMGRRNYRDGDPEKLHIQRVEAEDHDYDVGGAYWGGIDHSPLFCAFSDPETSENDPPVMIFVRAADVEQAKHNVLFLLKTEGWTFYE